MADTGDEVWLLGATGRTGRAVAARLHAADVPLVLVGRDRPRLDALCAQLGGASRTVVGPLDAALAVLAREAPGVVVNTVGPFGETASTVTRACPPGTHYVDISNEYPAVEAVLALDRRAADAGQVLVAAAGFGVLATESVLLRLCAGRPPALRVRVDAMASVATEPGRVGTALAGSIVEAVAFGGGQVRGGRLVRSRLTADPVRLTTPDGEVLTTVGGPSGELLAAWRASGADVVVAASSLVPDNPVLRAVSPAVSAVVRVPVVGRFVTGRLARVSMGSQPRPRPHSWAHARVEWHSGEVREGWLRLGDGLDFTVAATVEVTQRLRAGLGRPGAHTPGSLFGPGLVEALGGEFLVEPEPVVHH